jgi:hypothetical protein
MDKLRSLTFYIIDYYAQRKKLSISRLAKTIYLADWYAAIKLHRQITDVKWDIRYSGPYAYEIDKHVYGDKDFVISKIPSNSEIYQITTTTTRISITFSQDEKQIVDNILKQTWNMPWQSFLTEVYNTYPVRTQDRYKVVDLVALAQECEDCKNYVYA